MGGSIYTTINSLRSHVVSGEEEVQACQSYIETLLHEAAMAASLIGTKIKLEPEEEIAMYQFGEASVFG